MVFSSLPQHIQYAIYKLTTDDEFQKRFGEDQVLDQLDELKYDPFIEWCEYQTAMHNKFCCVLKNNLKFLKLRYLKFLKQFIECHHLFERHVEIEPMTLALWAYLYTIKSPVVSIEEDENISILDINIFFYLLQTKDYGCTPGELLTNSMNYCTDKMNLSELEAIEIFQKIIKINFRVLNMFPKLKIERKSVFNVDWMTSIATKVKQVSSYSTQEIYKEVPFCEIYYLFAQYCRQNGSEAIYLRTEEEIQIEIDLRSTELVVDRLIEKNVIEQDDRDYYIKQIHVVKEN